MKGHRDQCPHEEVGFLAVEKLVHEGLYYESCNEQWGNDTLAVIEVVR